MDNFNKRFADVMQNIGMQVIGDNEMPMTKDELERFLMSIPYMRLMASGIPAHPSSYSGR